MMHTEGPWKIVEHSWSDTGIYAGHDRIALLKIDEDIDEDDQERLEQQQVANARLFAAAPDLLVAALLVATDLENGVGNKATHVAFLRDAVAKAVGSDRETHKELVQRFLNTPPAQVPK